MIQFRPTTPEDQSELETLLLTVWNGDEGAVAYHGRGRRPGLLASIESEVIGYCATWRSKLHPTHAYVGVHVHPHWRGQGIGSRLWREITAGVTGTLKSATSDGQRQGQRFLERHGLKVSVWTHQPRLSLASLPDPENWVQHTLALGFELLPMTNLHGEKVQAELLHLHRGVYAHTHEHDPVTVDVMDEEDFLGDDLVPEWLFVARKNGVLAGVSSVRLDEPLPMLGWFGVTRAFVPVGRELTLALTGLALQSAARDGVNELTAELDSPDPNAMHLLRELPWQPERVWLTFTSVERLDI